MGTPGSMRGSHDRARIAQGAARLLAEHGMSDWSAAKRKAARQLGLPEGMGLPSNEDVQQALTDYHALFAADTHAVSLAAQRHEALRWMKRLERFVPILVGGVAAGWATVHSDVRIEIVADDPKSVEMALAGDGIRYSALPPRSDDAEAAGAELLIESPDMGIRLSVLTPVQRRNRPRRADEPRLAIADLSALLQES
ncbi:MAG: hypothetical protein ABI920_11180 [Casimicrobiaceae bacterium]